jgi:hypothetical protein
MSSASIFASQVICYRKRLALLYHSKAFSRIPTLCSKVKPCGNFMSAGRQRIEQGRNQSSSHISCILWYSADNEDQEEAGMKRLICQYGEAEKAWDARR